MNNDIEAAALTSWAAKGLPARLKAEQVALLLNCKADDIPILVSARKLKPLGKPRPNGVKIFSAVELFSLLAKREWLDDVTKTIGQHWERKNARRKATAPRCKLKLPPEGTAP